MEEFRGELSMVPEDKQMSDMYDSDELVDLHDELMGAANERMQEELEEERYMRTLALMQRVKHSIWFSIHHVPQTECFFDRYACPSDIEELARELGLGDFK